MKFATSAVVLATLAIESVSAGTIRAHAHKHIHQKKEAALNGEGAKRQWTPPPGYDWHTDTSNSGATAVASVEAPAATPSASSPAETNVPQATSAAAASESTGSTKTGTSLLNNLSQYVVSTVTKVGTTGRDILAGKNPTSADGFAWIGDDGSYVNTLTNNAQETITVLVWNKDGAAALGDAQYMDKHAPAISVKIPSGSSVPISMAAGASGGFVGVYSDTTWSDISYLLTNTIGEFTASGSDTTFDVSKEWYMDGHGMTIDTGGCVSSTVNDECAFVCKSGQVCGETGTYDLIQSSSSNCNRAVVDLGFGPNPEGGCRVDAASQKSVKTSFH